MTDAALGFLIIGIFCIFCIGLSVAAGIALRNLLKRF